MTKAAGKAGNKSGARKRGAKKRGKSPRGRLADYRSKRDFSKTPEPSGDASPRAGTRHVRATAKNLFFCVQKHLASHLHCDFRLEHDGALLSWAVPKGPSVNPADKRLAMRVEDHPLDYGQFEGVIPEGYGAGIVMLWDRGSWKPESPDVDQALADGELKFSLDGVKLKGSWVLVRTAGWGSRRGGSDGAARAESRSWLLIKHRDEWPGDIDITRAAPNSVKTSGDFAEILSRNSPSVWQSNRPGGGEISQMLSQVIEQAAQLKAKRGRPKAGGTKRPARQRAGKRSARVAG